MSLEILPTEEEIFCTHENTIKRGFRYNKTGKIQRFKCKDCGFKFVERKLPKTKHLLLGNGFSILKSNRCVDLA